MKEQTIFPFAYLGMMCGLILGGVYGVQRYLTFQMPVYLNFASAFAGAGYFLGWGLESIIADTS